MKDNKDILFEYGDPNKPRGNALAYWRLLTDAESESFQRIIATNFVISPLFIGHQGIAATFPPQVIETYDRLLDIARKAEIDLIFVDELKIPLDDFDFDNFFKTQFARFNKIVAAYLKRYAVAFENLPEHEAVGTENSELENINNIDRLTQEARQSLLAHPGTAQAQNALLRIRKIAATLNSPSYKYDVEDLLEFLNCPDERVEELSRLYHRKFIAIYTERYEDAEKLKRAIRHLSRSISLELPS
ncbi:MAG: hypothetical protein LBC99_03425 [Spirochaetota bacterium]|jgi:hypothetical protein|nr:hypothetical protein [Spirochaetota bacterium]